MSNGITPELIIAIFSSLSAIITAVIASRSKVNAEIIQELRDRIDRIERELDAERNRNKELTLTLDGYMTEKLKANKEILDLKLQLDERDAIIRRQEMTIDDLERRVKSLEAELFGKQSYEPPQYNGEEKSKAKESGKDRV